MSDPLHAFPVVAEQTLRALARYPSRTARLTMDHSVMVPLHFLDPEGLPDLTGTVTG